MRPVAAVAAGVLLVSAIAVLARFSGQPSPLENLSADPWTSAITVHSSSLARDMPVQVFIPEGGSEEMPVLFLFHGRGGDETQWMAGHFGDGVGIDRLAHTLIDEGQIVPVAIVSAAIDDSYGIDSGAAADGYSHGPYETYIIGELVPQIETHYLIGGSASQRAIGGLSMGGFAALNAGLGHEGMFGSIAGLSPAFFVDPPRDRLWIYGADGERDLLRLADVAFVLELDVFLGFGDRDYDWIQHATRALAARLAARGISAEPLVVSGGHDASTWRQLAEPMLTRLFGVPP